jgi:polygalacturonase
MTSMQSFDNENSADDSLDDAQISKAVFTRRHFWKLSATGLAVGFFAPSLLVGGTQALAASHLAPAGPLPWPEANAILASVIPPIFPNANFVVTDYGASGDGQTDNTVAFQNAILACNVAGGGHVVVPAGTYVTGAIYLKSQVDLHLDAGSILMFSGDASQYPLVLTRYESIECVNHSPMIYAYGERNIALTGSGILDASNTASWNTGSDRAGVLEPLVAAGVPPLQRNVSGQLRSTFVEPYSCTNVLLQGVTLRKSQFWQFHPTLCTNVIVDGVTASFSGANSDSCDPECCDHVVIKNSTFKAGDDNIAIKSGRDADGRRVNVPTQNVVIWNNTFEGPDGAITLGSELTGGIQNIYAYNNSIVGSGTNYALFVKSNTQRGGFARNVHIDTLHGAHLHGEVAFFDMHYMGQTGTFLPDFRGPFTFNNVILDTAPIVLNLNGLSNDLIGPMSLSNCAFTNITNPISSVNNVTSLTYTNVTINGKSVSGNISNSISNLMVADTANASAWSIQNAIQDGVQLYGDRAYTISSLPSLLVGAPWIRTANGSKSVLNSPLVTFTLLQQADVYVTLDTRLGNPPMRSWMDTTWSNTGLNLLDDEQGVQRSFILYEKTFPAGQVTLGPDAGINQSSMYTVIVL